MTLNPFCILVHVAIYQAIILEWLREFHLGMSTGCGKRSWGDTLRGGRGVEEGLSAAHGNGGRVMSALIRR